MRFMIMHKNDPQTEAGHKPPMELVTKMGELMGEYMKTGRFVDGAGLRNDLTVIDGPFTESKELLGGFAVMELSGVDEAIALCRRYAAILGGTLEIDVRLVEQDDEAA
jgi:hypothetical protein